MEMNARTSEGDCGTSSGLSDCKEQGNAALGSNVDSEREETVLNIRERFDSRKANACGDSKESPVGPVQSEDTNMDKPSDDGETTDVEVQMSTNADLSQKNPTSASKFLVSSTDDLDEMMDIGTVDQVEQEAQMKEEKQSNSQSLEGDNAQPPAISNAEVKPPDPESLNEQSSFAEKVQEEAHPGKITTSAEEAVEEESVSAPPLHDKNPEAENRASPPEGSRRVEEEMDVKPAVSPALVETEQGETANMASHSQQSSSTPLPETTSERGTENSPQGTPNGMNNVQGNASKEQTGSPVIKVKDEPADDDEYEQALISPTSAASVKDEPNTAKEDLRIGSVFSVMPSSLPLAPAANPVSLHMSCSHCNKSLIKGQTAFQRKGSPALFCTTSCLTASLTALKPSKVCQNCLRLILRPQDVILSPDAKGVMKEFCSQNCLTSFNFKKNGGQPVAKTVVPPSAPQSICSVCLSYCISKHEVILNGAVNKICGDVCFARFRSLNNLSMAGCENCGTYCHKKPLLLKMDNGSKTLCNVECLEKYKEKTKVLAPCTMCHTSRYLAEMVDNKNADESVNLFCSSSCVMAFKVQTVSASGARLNCDSCGKFAVPAYHLAMSDTSIRNFCTLPCVMAFQEKFKNNKKQGHCFTKLPIGSSQSQDVASAESQRRVTRATKLINCAQCNHSIGTKPELIHIEEKIVFVCSSDCSQAFKIAKCVKSICEQCKTLRIAREAKRINGKDCFFCSDGCKQLFQQELTKMWGKHCQSCIFCQSTSQKLVTAQYGGSTEEFCSDDCRSKYTMLFCHVAKCDTCGRKGKLKQSLSLIGKAKHFCDLNCLLQFCCETVATQGEVLIRPPPQVEATPVISTVVSLAEPPVEKGTVPSKTAQQRNTTKNSSCPSVPEKEPRLDKDSAAHLPSTAKSLKNKAVLCKPLVQNKGVSCRTQTTDGETQTNDNFPKVLLVPVPVPVYIPVPMNMYAQCTPKPVGIPLPVPVPMFIPVTMNSAERIVETIQDIKEKIPSDPFEAELILMAEMVAQQNEGNDKEKTQSEKRSEAKDRERQEAAPPDDHASNYSDELDTDDLASLLNNWEDPSSDAGARSPGRLDVPDGLPSGADSVAPPPRPPPMDIEADVSIGALAEVAKPSERSQKSLTSLPSKRRQAPRKAREKKARKSQKLSKATESASKRGAAKKAAVVPDVPKLKSEYGVDAWKQWIHWRQTQPNIEKPRYARAMVLNEDVLQCTTAELSYGLCCFINEVKRPNGEPYSPDSLFYLCLGIQQHLFENGRVENIFMDRFYAKFSNEFTTMLKRFDPSATVGGYVNSRVEEEFLWDCKQLGAYSPIVLLNTLLFFCCKHFGFTTVQQHRQLSFAHVMRCTKTNRNYTKTTYLRFYPPVAANEAESETPAKRRKEESRKEILEMMENTENPLRCPVRLYEFYLSKCSESVKQRTNIFYLLPERSCVPNSPLWFSSTPLDDATLETMLIRILTVRELHLKSRTAGGRKPQIPGDQTLSPDEEEEEEEEEDNDEDSE